jgi:hypothetical protein
VVKFITGEKDFQPIRLFEDYNKLDSIVKIVHIIYMVFIMYLIVCLFVTCLILPIGLSPFLIYNYHT